MSRRSELTKRVLSYAKKHANAPLTPSGVANAVAASVPFDETFALRVSKALYNLYYVGELKRLQKGNTQGQEPVYSYGHVPLTHEQPNQQELPFKTAKKNTFHVEGRLVKVTDKHVTIEWTKIEMF